MNVLNEIEYNTKNSSKKCGVYAIFNESKECVYIGKSVSMLGRLNSHKFSNIASFVFYKTFELPSSVIDEVESALIGRIQPKYNSVINLGFGYISKGDFLSSVSGLVAQMIEESVEPSAVLFDKNGKDKAYYLPEDLPSSITLNLEGVANSLAEVQRGLKAVKLDSKEDNSELIKESVESITKELF